MPRRAILNPMWSNYETTADPNVVRFQHHVTIMATEIGGLEEDFWVEVNLDDTPQQIEVKLRDASLIAIRAKYPLLSDWSANDIYQPQIRRN